MHVRRKNDLHVALNLHLIVFSRPYLGDAAWHDMRNDLPVETHRFARVLGSEYWEDGSIVVRNRYEGFWP